MSETGTQSQPDDAMVDLLIKQVTEGLSAAEQRALDVLDKTVVSEYSRDFEGAAAAISLAGTVPVEPPAALRATLLREAETHVARADTVRALPPRAAPALPDSTRRPGRNRTGAWGWLAAAACLVLAVFGWYRAPQPMVAPVADVQVALPSPVVEPAVPVPPTAAEERAALMANAESLKVTLVATKDAGAKGVTGDVVWDPVTQKGFVHFAGLAANDPALRQYQLWIFDGERDKRYPVDAGLFDVPADSAEVIIPIHASLPIHMAKAFAVTSEQPGGVVVSGLAHVLVLGAVG